MNDRELKREALDRQVSGTLHANDKSPHYLGLVFSMLLLPITADADQTQEKRDFYAYEQCANRCQVTLDKELFACNTRRNVNPDSVSEDCEKTAIEAYEKSMAKCPTDPRLKL